MPGIHGSLSTAECIFDTQCQLCTEYLTSAFYKLHMRKVSHKQIKALLHYNSATRSTKDLDLLWYVRACQTRPRTETHDLTLIQSDELGLDFAASQNIRSLFGDLWEQLINLPCLAWATGSYACARRTLIRKAESKRRSPPVNPWLSFCFSCTRKDEVICDLDSEKGPR